MHFLDYFSDNYDMARDKFLLAVNNHGLKHETFINPETGPEGQSLYTDVAWYGKTDAEKLMVFISGTHGVEFLVGSGCQSAWLNEGHIKDINDETAVLFIHSINPFGAAWRRRYNEDNVDLNRNFVDHNKEVFENPYYADLHDIIVPPALSGTERDEADRKLKEYRQTQGESAFQTGILGQYTHADGFYYGGTEPVWSNRILMQIINKYCRSCKHLALIDYHSGLGAFGYGVIGVTADPGSAMERRARRWYGESMTTFVEVGEMYGFPNYSQLVDGMLMYAFVKALPETNVTPAGIEFGTYPIERVTEAERADAWLYKNLDADADIAEQIRATLEKVYYPNTPDWLEMVWRRSEQIARQSLVGLVEDNF